MAEPRWYDSHIGVGDSAAVFTYLGQMEDE